MRSPPCGIMSGMEEEMLAFWKARLDADEALAKAAWSPSPWKAATHQADNWIVTDATGEPLIYNEGTPSLEEATHIARHDPARVLRDVVADRAILDLFGRTLAIVEHPPLLPEGPGAGKISARDHEEARRELAVLKPVTLARVAVYSDHPDYREEWAP